MSALLERKIHTNSTWIYLEMLTCRLASQKLSKYLGLQEYLGNTALALQPIITPFQTEDCTDVQ